MWKKNLITFIRYCKESKYTKAGMESTRFIANEFTKIEAGSCIVVNIDKINSSLLLIHKFLDRKYLHPYQAAVRKN